MTSLGSCGKMIEEWGMKTILMSQYIIPLDVLQLQHTVKMLLELFPFILLPFGIRIGRILTQEVGTYFSHCNQSNLQRKT